MGRVIAARVREDVRGVAIEVMSWANDVVSCEAAVLESILGRGFPPSRE